MLIPEGYAQVNFIFSGFGVPQGAEVTFGLGLGETDDNPAEVAEAMHGVWTDTFLTVMTNAITFDETRVKFGPNDIGPFASFSGGDNGALTPNGSTPQVAILITKQTASGGRSGRGRMYVPGVTESDTDADGALQGPYLSAWQDAADDFLTNTVVAGYSPELLHGEDSPAPFPYPITSLSVSGTVATQRRRLRG